MTLLGKAIALAAQAHEEATDRQGAAFILHPIRVMLRVAGEEAQIVAILHDVVEKTAWTLDDLRERGFPESIVEAVDYLTHREDESYTEYVKRAGQHPIAREVKLADLEDHMVLTRIGELTEDDLSRMEKYHRHWLLLRAP